MEGRNKLYKDLILDVKQIRLDNRYQQAYLAAEVGISRTHFSRMERGKNLMSIPKLQHVLFLMGYKLAPVKMTEEEIEAAKKDFEQNEQ